MKILFAVVLFLVATALYIAAGFLGAVPAAARLNNFAGACVAGGLLVATAPFP